jgi:ParB-like chromosome segregation protein Spo0J
MFKIEQVSPDKLIPYVNNARTHSQHQVAQVAASIREFGFTNPVLIDKDNGVIAGHGRIQAAQKLGLKEVPCIRLEHLTAAQKKAYIIADNKLALNAGWDEELLALELAELGDMGFDLELTGFDEAEIDELLGEEGETTDAGNGSLADRFLLPPFSVLNAREGWWQDRKRAWLAIGIKSELGRGGGC